MANTNIAPLRATRFADTNDLPAPARMAPRAACSRSALSAPVRRAIGAASANSGWIPVQCGPASMAGAATQLAAAHIRVPASLDSPAQTVRQVER